MAKDKYTKENPLNNPRRRNFLKAAGASAVGVGAGSMLAATNAGAAADGEPIPVGAALPISGAVAADGIEFRRGFEMACEDINAMGGILGRPLRPIVEDTESEGPSRTVPAMERLVDRHGVYGIINGFNVNSQGAEHDVVADSGICYLHANAQRSHDEVVESDPDRYFGCFQVCPHEEWYGPGLLAFLNNLEETGQYTFENKTLGIIDSPIDYSARIARALERDAAEYGWEVVFSESVNPPISEWGPVLANLRRNPPEVIAVTHFFPQDLAALMTQFRRNPTQSLMYMQYGPSLPAFREIGGEAVNGTLYSTTIAALPDEKGNEFGRRYQEKFGDSASHLVGAQTYDATMVWATAAAIAGGPGAPDDFEQNRKVADRIRNLIYRGVLGVTYTSTPGQSSLPYPGGISDPSLGMPHQFLQIMDHEQTPLMIGPEPYEQGHFMVPPWIET